MKKTHKYVTSYDYTGVCSRSIDAACKVHNKTYSWRGTYRWDRVDCKRCIAKRRRK